MQWWFTMYYVIQEAIPANYFAFILHKNHKPLPRCGIAEVLGDMIRPRHRKSWSWKTGTSCEVPKGGMRPASQFQNCSSRRKEAPYFL
jgi:hypothetical protein